MAKKFEHVDQPLDEGWQEEINQRKADKGINTNLFDVALGTIGG